MQVAAVVEPAGIGMRAQVGHQAGQVGGLQLAQAEFLEAG
jgi:hypothetical protein